MALTVMANSLTTEHLAILCRNVTPEMRDFCARELYSPTWPEEHLRGAVAVDIHEISADDWWTTIHDRVPTPPAGYAA